MTTIPLQILTSYFVIGSCSVQITTPTLSFPVINIFRNEPIGFYFSEKKKEFLIGELDLGGGAPRYTPLVHMSCRARQLICTNGIFDR